jgi:CheY-like chemotaxis protein
LIPIRQLEEFDVHSSIVNYAAHQQPAAMGAQKDLPLHNYNILLVDDVTANLLVVATKLQDMGAKIQSASNGQVAVDLVFEAALHGVPFDFVFMDLQMPVMDGFEATKILRERGFTNPIVALTADHDSDGRAVKSGCNLVLQKPADRSTLLRTVINLAPKKR